MNSVCKFILIIVLLAPVPACGKTRVEVIRECDVTPPKFKTVSVPRFVNGVGDVLPYEAPVVFAAAVVAKLKQRHPRAFSEVIAWPSRKQGVLMVQGQIVEYETRSRMKRILTMGLGRGRLKLEIVLADGSKEKTVERFTTLNKARSMDKMIDSAVEAVVKRVVQYGYSR